MLYWKLTCLMIMASVYLACGQEPADTKVQYKDLTITLKGIVQDSRTTFKDNNSLNSKIITEQTGYKLLPDTIELYSNNLDILKIQECVETSVTVTNDGPHCDLTDWKHYTSEWTDLPHLNNHTYVGLKYSEAESHQFPPVTKDELVKAVKDHCGGDWMALLNLYKSIGTAPFYVATSRVFILIKAKDKITGQDFTKEITINVPMGD